MSKDNINNEIKTFVQPMVETSDSAQKYNFQRPDKFSKEHLRGLFDTHKEFAHQFAVNLTSYLRMQVDANVVAVDKLTYEEYTASMPDNMTYGAFEFSPLSGHALIGVGHDVLASIVDRMLGGDGNCDAKNRDLTDVEEALSKKVIEKSIKTLETVWQDIAPIKCTSVKTDNNFSLIEIANKNEIVAVVTIEIQLNAQRFGLVNLCFPYPMLETILGEFANRHIYQTKGKVASQEEKTELLGKLKPSKIDIEVMLGKTDISINDFMKLKIGDIIKLDTKTDDELIMKVNNNKKFFVKPGTVKNKISVKITEKYDETEDAQTNYL